MDRTAVILEIFRRHARSPFAKARVELMRLSYRCPACASRAKATTASAAAVASRARTSPVWSGVDGDGVVGGS